MTRFEYDILVIGGGSAGLTAAGLSASLGARTVLIEKGLPGGDCTWHSCVPSKAILHIAGLAKLASTSEGTGVSFSGVKVDGRRVLERVREIREKIYRESDSPDVLRSFGIDVIEGSARFTDPHSVLVTSDNEEIRSVSSRYFVIATGTRPAIPEIPGLFEAHLHTNESIFELSDLPQSLLILGAGTAGLELGQAFSRLGVEVSIIERKKRKEGPLEPDHQELLVSRLERDGIRFFFEAELRRVVRGREFLIEVNGSERTLLAEQVLVASGRVPVFEDLELENAGVDASENGIRINHSCQTSVSHIYACGDVAEGPNLTHVAEEMARTAVRRILLKLPTAYERTAVPFVLYTDPEAGRVGESKEELESRGSGFRTIRLPYDRIDRARIVGSTEGEIMVHYSPASGRILGAHVVGQHAGEILQEFVVAMTHGLSLRELSGTIHPYPGWMQGARRAADQIYVQSGAAKPLKILGSIFGYRGEVSGKIGGDEVI